MIPEDLVTQMNQHRRYNLNQIISQYRQKSNRGLYLHQKKLSVELSRNQIKSILSALILILGLFPHDLVVGQKKEEVTDILLFPDIQLHFWVRESDPERPSRNKCEINLALRAILIQVERKKN